ncbi:hypothetical protein LshimejAT787_1501950 [Lyophyllum shimeji]|uniref:Uncharacterized protein n=1 Tax=Lyophyllum shimeji TaxID=47721 RepID=A0A9P3PZL2_LYOSH|nr:hypothetical protein LshimejAT787_1501950 [Lyophyllum shimeji]
MSVHIAGTLATTRLVPHPDNRISDAFLDRNDIFFVRAPQSLCVTVTTATSVRASLTVFTLLRADDLDVDAELGSNCDALAVLRAPVRGALLHSEVVGGRVASMSSSHAEPVPVTYPSLVSAESAGACVNQCRSRNDHCSAFAT